MTVVHKNVPQIFVDFWDIQKMSLYKQTNAVSTFWALLKNNFYYFYCNNPFCWILKVTYLAYS